MSKPRATPRKRFGFIIAEPAERLAALAAIRIIKTQNAAHVFFCLGERWNAAVFLDRAAAGVVCGERKLEIPLIAIEQHAQMAHAAFDVFDSDHRHRMTLCRRAVSGMSCMSPMAPFCERARR